MKFAPFLVLLSCLSFIGCGETSSDSAPVASINSGVEGVPLPKGATPAKGTLSDNTWYVPTMSYDELRDWYEVEMPTGKDFKQWKWCDTGGLIGSNKDGDDGLTLIYSKGQKRILGVSLVPEDDPDPAAVLIGADNSGPC